MPHPIHIGHEIESRFNELRMSQTEFGSRIGVPQQNIRRIFEKSSIDTDKLLSICAALNFNFFELYCDLATVKTAGRDYVEKGNISHSGTEYNGQVERASDLVNENAELKRKLIEAQDKIIKLMEERK